MNIETELRSFLSLTFENVYADSPNPQPETYITFERTGGDMTDVVVDHPAFAIQCYAPTRYEASELAHQVWKVLPSFVDYSTAVTRVECEALYNFPLEHRPRYQITTVLTVADY